MTDITKTITDFKSKLNLTGPATVTVKSELKYSRSTRPTTVPVGTKVDMYFSPSGNRGYFEFDGLVRPVSLILFHNRFSFTKMPSVRTLKRWDDEGYCKTITGQKTEPDGFGDDGSPSWLLVMGMI